MPRCPRSAAYDPKTESVERLGNNSCVSFRESRQHILGLDASNMDRMRTCQIGCTQNKFSVENSARNQPPDKCISHPRSCIHFERTQSGPVGTPSCGRQYSAQQRTSSKSSDEVATRLRPPRPPSVQALFMTHPTLASFVTRKYSELSAPLEEGDHPTRTNSDQLGPA